ncbi:acyl-CoA dehydrogenase [Cupriavidus necator N-1]|uniref:Acyl-CoA dehydrogenase n=1 Tax=Cupriavidus necator (strain ATCC 43291 / DSM 13513 / CCUG 52238 / LMG 8453 / N-1) TaxID=1042878 RepID=F8GRH3_CUPNN|nr:acyl-CoA dehydrogenase family protein [Cupriavidus necator]AEI79633.1 acyl-CoA dehydrogenase [Cupriavidus necator N-1]MDX6010734.1 acyl-CoA dehydrogenase family protein [Cupriavidus necator]
MHNAYSDALDALLRDCCPPATVRALEQQADPQPLWQALLESGFADCLLPESAGGAALPLRELAPVLFVTGRHALPLPLAQTIFARALLQAHGIALPAGPVALAGFEDGAGAALVADARHAQWFLLQDGERCLLLAAADARAEATGAHHDLTLRVPRPDASAPAAFALPAGTLRTLGACLHTAQLAGALSHVLDLTLQYANDRQQFGRAIGKFQAIQHQVSEMAEHVAAARVAAQLACDSGTGTPDRLRAAIGKLRASDAVTPVAAIAHAVHGAIGITEEYDLQLYTRRLHAWRMADGSERWWSRVLGEAVCASAGRNAVELVREWCEPAPAA